VEVDGAEGVGPGLGADADADGEGEGEGEEAEGEGEGEEAEGEGAGSVAVAEGTGAGWLALSLDDAVDVARSARRAPTPMAPPTAATMAIAAPATRSVAPPVRGGAGGTAASVATWGGVSPVGAALGTVTSAIGNARAGEICVGACAKAGSTCLWIASAGEGGVTTVARRVVCAASP
jgi:hypothetical protein